MPDLISVIIPVYKTEKYLARCVESVRAQTYTDLEILLVDDGSPDNAPALCDDFAKRDARIKVIHKTNGGLSSSRNAGLDVASGIYVSFVDSDDYIDPYMIERLHQVISKHHAEVAMLQYKEVSCDPPLPSPKRAGETVYTGTGIATAFLKLKIDSVCTGLYLKTAIADHRFLMGKTSEDIPFNFEIFGHINTFVHLPERRYYYFHNPNSISNGPLDANMFNYLNFRYDIYQHHLEAGHKTNIRLAEALYARAAFGLLMRLALYGHTPDLHAADCRAQLTKVFRTHQRAFYTAANIPFSRKAMAFILNCCFPLIRLIKNHEKDTR